MKYIPDSVHYTSHASGVECIQVTEHLSFCLGNAVKYIWRADGKNNAVEDLEKARWYLDREIARRSLAASAHAPAVSPPPPPPARPCEHAAAIHEVSAVNARMAAQNAALRKTIALLRAALKEIILTMPVKQSFDIAIKALEATKATKI